MSLLVSPHICIYPAPSWCGRIPLDYIWIFSSRHHRRRPGIFLEADERRAESTVKKLSWCSTCGRTMAGSAAPSPTCARAARSRTRRPASRSGSHGRPSRRCAARPRGGLSARPESTVTSPRLRLGPTVPGGCCCPPRRPPATRSDPSPGPAGESAPTTT
jgi:hypothetical protein